MSRRAMMSLMTIVLMATFAVASTMQQSKPNPQDPMPSNPATQDKSATSPKKSDSMQNTPPSTALSSDDRKFIMEAAHGGMMEVKLGQLAVDKATNADVK